MKTQTVGTPCISVYEAQPLVLSTFHAPGPRPGEECEVAGAVEPKLGSPWEWGGRLTQTGQAEGGGFSLMLKGRRQN